MQRVHRERKHTEGIPEGKHAVAVCTCGLGVWFMRVSGAAAVAWGCGK